MNSVADRLLLWLKDAKRVVVVGVGNELRGDDFVGMAVVKGLKEEIDEEHILLVESETVPESFLEEIVEFRPTHVLVVDAGLLELAAGEVKFVESREFLAGEVGAVSTHTLPLRIFCQYLEKTIGAKVALLIIQVKNTDFGEKMSREVKETAEKLRKTLKKILSPR